MSKNRLPKQKSVQDDTGRTTRNKVLPVQTFDSYQCTGNVCVDFPALCSLLDLTNIPVVCTKNPISSTADTDTGEMGETQTRVGSTSLWFKPCMNVETEDPSNAKKIKISGWRVNEQMFSILQKLLPSLNQLLSLEFWQAGLTDSMLISLTSTFSLCSRLRWVTLEGNALPDQSFHVLLSEDSLLTNLSLRNNRIGDTGAQLIGSALSSNTSANKTLLSLNLSFNNIGDAGATYIAQGLRLNRTLAILSLSNNQIGDLGAARLAEVLGAFTLTHEEVMERRKLLLQRALAETGISLRTDVQQTSFGQLGSGQSRTVSQMDHREKDASRKENREKSHKKTIDKKTIQSKPGTVIRAKQPPAQEDKSTTSYLEDDSVEAVNPLLDHSVRCRNGKVFLPGNGTLSSLNLSGNRITEKSLPLFLASLEKQENDGKNLLRLCLQRNLFPLESQCYVKINELLALRNAHQSQF